MRELVRPDRIESDPNATEVISLWLAHNDIHISLLLGMWEDAEQHNVDERDACGQLLADTTKHIANGLSKSHGCEKEDTIRQIKEVFLASVDSTNTSLDADYVAP
jgi:hypothetical protein